MAAPTFVSAGTGWVVTTGTGNGTLAGTTAGNLIMVHVVGDGVVGSDVITVAAGSNVERLSGTDNSLTTMDAAVTGLSASNPLGNPTAALQTLYMGRSLGGTVTVTASGAGDDVFARIYEFTNVNTGTIFDAVIENTLAGDAARDAQTSATVNDVGVTTLGVDRLALNFVGIDDDLTGLAAFAGETGGDWVLATAIFESSTGTDATLALMTAAMPTAGTINGGSDAITSDNWGVIGFALIGTTVAATFTARPEQIFYRGAVGRASTW